jgi:hypothetical protein
MPAIQNLDSYQVSDDFFGAPYIDVDEQRDDPTPHRYVHGGFAGTDTRFSFYLPEPVTRYAGRLYQPLEGANAGHETVQNGPLGRERGSIEMTFRLGGYMVESNMGHIGDVMDAKAGADPTIYGWRAAAESARFSKFVAAQVLGAAPSYSYVYGGSGGARRSPLCLAYAPDVWDAALPYMGDAVDGDYGDFRRPRTVAQHFCSMFNVQRVLGDRIHGVIDAMSPGGSGDPFAGLDTHQREELATLYRLGYPRGDESMIAQPMGQIWFWSSYAERIQRDYPEYWEAFWTKPGHVGFDQPRQVERDLIDVRATVVRPLFPKDLVEGEQFSGPEFAQLRGLAALFAGMHDAWDVPMALELDDLGPGYRLGTGVRVTSGAAAGRQLYCINGVGNVLLCDGEGEASNLRFSGVLAGDEVHVDNHAFLAFCYYYRHHISRAEVDYDSLRVDDVPVYPQYEIPEMSPFMGTVHTGRFEGKLMWIHHTHDSSLWPSQGIGMKNNVERERGPEEAKQHFRLRWSENAEHGMPGMLVSLPGGRAVNTWLIDPTPIIEQGLADLALWVEKGVEPAGSNFDYLDGKVTLPQTAAERGGIQPVVTVTADGGSRTEVKVGEDVVLEVHAEVPPGAGTIVAVKWDFDGSGGFPFTQEVDGSQAAVTLSTTHAYDRPGTFFATALVESHREGDVRATARRIPNLASARVVVS